MMKINTPLFVVGLLVFITPVIGFPNLWQTVLYMAYGVAIMILVASPLIFKKEERIDEENKN